MAFPYGDLKTPQAKREAAGQLKVRVLQDCHLRMAFLPNTPGAIIAAMPAAFRAVDFINHRRGEDLELGAVGWARGPENPTRTQS